MLDERFAHYVQIFMFSFSVGGGVKRELWEGEGGGGELKIEDLGVTDLQGCVLLRGSVPHYMP